MLKELVQELKSRVLNRIDLVKLKSIVVELKNSVSGIKGG